LIIAYFTHKSQVMEKPHADHVSHTEKPDGLSGVDAFPLEARAEAGVLLNVAGPDGTSLRLAKDGHVSA
jgi:hypothetical protein